MEAALRASATERERLRCGGGKILTITCSSERVTKVTVLRVASGAKHKRRKKRREGEGDNKREEERRH